MDTDIVAPATPPSDAPPVAEPVTTSDDTSIAEHEAQYGKSRVEEGGKDNLPPRTKHRAQKDMATPADVPRIAELTKKLRDAERERDDWKTKASTRPEPAKDQAPAPVVPKVEAPSDKPSWKTFEEQIGEKYQTWADAQDAYVDARDDWKEVKAKAAYAEQQQSSAQQAVLQGYSTKAQEYAKTTPDFFEKMKDAAPILDGIPDLLFQSIVRHDNGPEIAYYLVTHPSDLDDMCLAADGKSVSESSVALLQRRLSHYRAPAAPTGSVAAVPARTAPRPPNPVRTGPLKTGDEPPGDDASIAEHEKFYGKRRR